MDRKPRRPRTPLLFLLLGSAVLVAAASFVSAQIGITNEVLEPVVTSALVAAIAIVR